MGSRYRSLGIHREPVQLEGANRYGWVGGYAREHVEIFHVLLFLLGLCQPQVELLNRGFGRNRHLTTSSREDHKTHTTRRGFFFCPLSFKIMDFCYSNRPHLIS